MSGTELFFLSLRSPINSIQVSHSVLLDFSIYGQISPPSYPISFYPPLLGTWGFIRKMGAFVDFLWAGTFSTGDQKNHLKLLQKQKPLEDGREKKKWKQNGLGRRKERVEGGQGRAGQGETVTDCPNFHLLLLFFSLKQQRPTQQSGETRIRGSYNADDVDDEVDLFGDYSRDVRRRRNRARITKSRSLQVEVSVKLEVECGWSGRIILPCGVVVVVHFESLSAIKDIRSMKGNLFRWY